VSQGLLGAVAMHMAHCRGTSYTLVSYAPCAPGGMHYWKCCPRDDSTVCSTGWHGLQHRPCPRSTLTRPPFPLSPPPPHQRWRRGASFLSRAHLSYWYILASFNHFCIPSTDPVNHTNNSMRFCRQTFTLFLCCRARGRHG
jgi:hypothetical protein